MVNSGASADLHHASKFTVTERTNITQPAGPAGTLGCVGEFPLSARVHASVKIVGAGQLFRMSVPLS